MNAHKLLARRILLSAAAITLSLVSHAQTSKPASPQASACHLSRGRNVLWELAQCCSSNLASDQDCREYNAANNYVIIKDNALTKPEAFLLIPSQKVTGIEDKRIFLPPFLNLWANAWDQSERYPGWGDRRIGMAINSAHARTQDQLHVHISCINPRVAQILDEKAAQATEGKPLPYSIQLPPANNTYAVSTVDDLTDGESPFQIASQVSGMGDMANKSIAVVKSKLPGRYFVLTTAYQNGKGGAAEELLDQRCTMQ
jgi:CDP-diacylglycerol pyrophosphatase